MQFWSPYKSGKLLYRVWKPMLMHVTCTSRTASMQIVKTMFYNRQLS